MTRLISIEIVSGKRKVKVSSVRYAFASSGTDKRSKHAYLPLISSIGIIWRCLCSRLRSERKETEREAKQTLVFNVCWLSNKFVCSFFFLLPYFIGHKRSLASFCSYQMPEFFFQNCAACSSRIAVVNFIEGHISCSPIHITRATRAKTRQKKTLARTH